MKEDFPQTPILPPLPIDKIVQPITRFLHIQAASGVVLLICAIIALIAANSPWSSAFLGFWKTEIGFTAGDFEFRHSLKHLINDGLMVIFFFVIGLEVKREIVHGQLGQLKTAALPIAAALGGMLVPASLYLMLQMGQPAMRGWGITMATDIAFVVGCMAVLGSRVPHNLRVLLLSLAIVDDIGAILVIAVGYTESLHWGWLGSAVVGLVAVNLMARLGVRAIPLYVIAGVLVWFAFHESGVHATLAGVILGVMTPARSLLSETALGKFIQRSDSFLSGESLQDPHERAQTLHGFRRISRESISPLEYLENKLHPWSSFLIMPVFALANAGVPLQIADLNNSIAMAVMLGLVIGKPVGIVSVSWLATRLGWAALPEGINWKILTAAGCPAGIGFTMALFIAGLALTDEALNYSKVGILVGSAVSAALGMGLLLATLPRSAKAGR